MFFSNIHALLQRGVTLQFIVRAVGADSIEVTVLPSSESGSTGQALVPKTFTATPAEFDAEFAQIMGSYAATNASLHEQLAAVDIMAKAAKEAASSKATAPGKGKQPGQASPPTSAGTSQQTRMSDDIDDVDGLPDGSTSGEDDGNSAGPAPFVL